MCNITEDAALDFVNNNAANVSTAVQADYERELAKRYSTAKIAFDFVPVLVYVANDECVGYYDEEVECGYIA